MPTSPSRWGKSRSVQQRHIFFSYQRETRNDHAHSGHLAVAEYDDRDAEEDQSGYRQHHHHRNISKFQWQSVLAGGDNAEDSTQVNVASSAAASSRQLSRCYSARTRTVRRSLNPVFNEEFRFEVADDTLLQVGDERNTIRVRL